VSLEYLKKTLANATPPPWRSDWGNGDVESEHPEHRRITVCDRINLMHRSQEYIERGYEHPRDPNHDIEAIAAMRNYIDRLISVAEMARSYLKDPKKDQIELENALLNLES
jgi:hypothetical protein